MSIGKKIIVLGCPGSGKSVFSRKLQRLTGLPLFHLDNLWWKADRTHITRDEFDVRLAAILNGDAWIIDGDYRRTYETRIKACDTILFLDFPEEECMKGIIGRVGQKHPDMPWTASTLDPELVEIVRNYGEKRVTLYGLFERYTDKQLLIFHTRSELDAWLLKEFGQPAADIGIP